MDDVVAICVDLEDGGQRYFLTWGRIQATVDSAPVAELVLQFSHSCSLGSEPVSARVCPSLREAAESGSAPYFFESFHWFASRPIPFGDEYAAWRDERAEAMSAGREISYCGRP